MFAHLLGIRPLEWDRLTVGQTAALVGWVEKYQAEMKKAAAT